jgi:hypothetical protein
MGGFLSALSLGIPIAQTLGPEMQIGAREAQRQNSEAAFDKLLDQAGGPELDPFREYRKAGATVSQTTSAMSGDIGKMIQQKYSVHRMGEIMGGGDFRQILITAAGEGLVPWKEVLTYLKDPNKAPPVMPEDLKSNAQKWLASGPNIDDQTRSYVQSAIDGNDYGALKEINDKVIPPYQGSTLYATRGFNMIGNDSDGKPFITRFIEGSRGQPAHMQTVYPDTNQPVPPDKMKGARYIGAMADSGGGGYGGGYGEEGGYSTGAPSSFVPMGGPGPGAAAPPAAAPSTTTSSGITAPPPAPAPAGSPGQPLRMLHLSGTDQKTVTNIQALLPQIRHLQQDMQIVGPRWDRDLASRIFSKWMAQHFDYLPGSDTRDATTAGNDEVQKFKRSMANDPDYQKLLKDPDLAYTMSELITTDAVASVSLLAAAGSRASNLLNEFKGHIMEPNGNWGSIMTNIATLDAPDGPYRRSLAALGVTRPSTPPPADVSPAGRARARGGASSAASDIDKSDADFMNRFIKKKK